MSAQAARPVVGGFLSSNQRAPFSLQLCRAGVLLVWVALLLSDAASLFQGVKLLIRASPLQGMVVAALFVLPAVSAAAAALAMIRSRTRLPVAVSGHLSATRLPRWLRERWAPHADSQTRLSGPDLTWHLTGSAMLVAYAAVLVAGIVSPLNLAPGAGDFLTSTDALLGYSMLTAATVSTLLCVGFRFSYVLSLFPLQVAYLARAGFLGWDAVVAPTFLLIFNLTMVASLTMLFNRSAKLDQAVHDLDLQTREAARAEAAQIARRRADSYIHDNILSALGPAAAGVVGREYVQDAAQKALVSLDEFPGLPTAMAPTQLFAEVEKMARERCSSLEIDVTIDRRTSHTLIRPELVRAILGATREALANSQQHARRRDGRPVSRQLTMRGESGSLEVIVQDDGDTCDPQDLGTVSPLRHGIRGSIIRRMVDVGGRASVRCGNLGSGRGVCVTIGWEKQPLGDSVNASLPLDQGSLAGALQSKTARVVAAWAVLGTALMNWGESASFSSHLWPLVALVWQAAVAVILMWPEHPDSPGGEWRGAGGASRAWHASPKPGARVRDGWAGNWRDWLAIATVALANLLVLGPITTMVYPGYASWSLGTGWLLCVLLLLRGGPVPAWIAMASLGVTTFLWAFVTGRSLFVALGLMVGQLVAMTVWTAMERGSRSIMRSVAEAELETRAAQAQQIASRTSLILLGRRLDALAEKARPILTELARADVPTTDSLKDAAILEAGLRDEIRAPSLCDPSLVAAALDARRRGVEVVLLDDRGETPLPEKLRSIVCLAGVDALAHAGVGRVVIRLLPAGRRNVASVLVPEGTVLIRADAADS